MPACLKQPSSSSKKKTYLARDLHHTKSAHLSVVPPQPPACQCCRTTALSAFRIPHEPRAGIRGLPYPLPWRNKCARESRRPNTLYVPFDPPAPSRPPGPALMHAHYRQSGDAPHGASTTARDTSVRRKSPCRARHTLRLGSTGRLVGLECQLLDPHSSAEFPMRSDHFPSVSATIPIAGTNQ